MRARFQTRPIRLAALAAAIIIFASGCTTASSPTSSTLHTQSPAGSAALSTALSEPSDLVDRTSPTGAPLQTSRAATSTESPAGDGATCVPPADSGAQIRRAAETAVSKLPAGTLIAIESERHGTLWEIKIATTDGAEFEFHVTRDGGAVVDGPVDQRSSDRDRSQNRARIAAAKLSYADALDAIDRHLPGACVDELELDGAPGAVVWEVELHDASRTRLKFDVDAVSGAVAAHR